MSDANNNLNGGEAMKTVIKTTSSKNVDNYTDTAPQRLDGDIVVIEAYSRTLNDHGLYEHRMSVRAATADESRIVEQSEALKSLGEQVNDLKERELDAIIAGTHAAWKAEYLPLQKRYIAAVNA